MRGWFRLCVPMTVLILLAGCGGTGGTGQAAETADMRQPYHDMSGCRMEAAVSCEQEGLLWEAELQCDYVPGGESTVEVLSPETIAGVRAVISDTDWRLEYEGDCLDIGDLSSQEISPAACLPRLMSALRDGALRWRRTTRSGPASPAGGSRWIKAGFRMGKFSPPSGSAWTTGPLSGGKSPWTAPLSSRRTLRPSASVI